MATGYGRYARAGRAAPAAGSSCGGGAAGRWCWRVVSSGAQARVRPGGGPRLSSCPSIIAPEGSTARVHRRATSGRSRRSWPRCRRSNCYFSVVGIGGGGEPRDHLHATEGLARPRRGPSQEIIGEVQARALRRSPACWPSPTTRRRSAVRAARCSSSSSTPTSTRWSRACDTLLARARQIPGPGQRGQRPPGQQAGAHRRASTATAPRTSACRCGDVATHAADAAGRAAGQHLHPQQQAVRRDRAARPAEPAPRRAT